MQSLPTPKDRFSHYLFYMIHLAENRTCWFFCIDYESETCFRWSRSLSVETEIASFMTLRRILSLCLDQDMGQVDHLN